MSQLPDFYDETKNYVIRRSTFREHRLKKLFFSSNGLIMCFVCSLLLLWISIKENRTWWR